MYAKKISISTVFIKNLMVHSWLLADLVTPNLETKIAN